MLYTSSMARYGKSPYIYPLYGLGELPQAFARLSAIHGGTYMLDKPIEEIVTDEATGKFTGVTSGGETVKAPIVIGSPDYFGAGQEKEGKQRVVEIGKVVRAICLLKHNIPGTDESDSVQIVIPQNQVNRRNGGSGCCRELSPPAATDLMLSSAQPPQTSTLPQSLRRTTSARRATRSRSSAQSVRRRSPSARSHLGFSCSARSSKSESWYL